MPFGSLSNVLEIKSAEGFRGSSVLQQSYPLTGYATASAAPAFSPLSLFTGGIQGVWYDPSDLSTMFTDSAGTTPVGTPGNGSAQPVGKLLDKSGNGNHATQATASARPELSAKYNLLTYTEQFDNGVWALYNSATKGTPNTIVAPDGTLTADPINLAAIAGSHIYQGVSFSANSYTFSVYVKSNSGSNQTFRLRILSLSQVYSADLTATTSWQQFSLTTTTSAVSGNVAIINDSLGNAASLALWGADLRLTNDGVGLPVYQRVADSLTYDAVGFPYYLLADGVDDGLVTPSVNLTSTSNVSHFTAVRKLSNGSGVSFVFTNQDSAYTRNGLFGLTAYNIYDSPTSGWGVSSKGTSGQGVSVALSSYPPPQGRIVTGLSSISSPSVAMRLDGSLISTNTGSQGTGSYGNFAIGVFYCASGIPFNSNSRIYGLIIRGASSTATEVTNSEAWLNGKAKIY